MMDARNPKNINVLDEAIDALRKTAVPAGPPRVVIDRVLAAGDGVQFQEKPAWVERIYAMKRYSRIAAILLLAAGITVVMSLWPTGRGNIAFADVIAPIMNARTATYKIITGTGDKATVIEDMVLNNRIHRTIAGVEGVTIIDLESLQILNLDPKNKTAMYIDMKGLPQKLPSPVDSLRNMITEVQNSPHLTVEELGVQEVDGRDLIGFRARLYSQNPKTGLTIWVEPKTAVPTRIDVNEGQLSYVLSDVQFDVDLDESLFSMDAPEGYTQQQSQLDLMGSTEEDFIVGLRIMAENFGDGVFPDSVAIENYISETQKKFYTMKLSNDERLQLGMKLEKHLMFLRFFKGQGQWHYAGAGVKLGDADTAIFWYQPAGSQTWRVIYGDLHVEDTPAENIPQVGESKSPEPPIGYQTWAQSKFAGAENDVWHITAGDIIEAHSMIDVRKGPVDASFLPIQLPYPTAKLVEVKHGGETVDFTHVKDGEYHLQVPWQKLQQGDRQVECVWTMPLGNLTETDYGYDTVLKSLIPVVEYRLTIELAEDCGWENSKNPDQKSQWLFSKGNFKPGSEFGTCGMAIRKKKP
jgi:hypothetical protein